MRDHVLRGEFPAPPSSRRQHHAASPTAPRPGAATPRYHWTHLICEEVKLQAWCCRPPLHEMLLIMGCGLFVHTASLAGSSSSSRCSAQRVEWLVTILNTWICICIQIFTFQSRLYFWDELPVGRVPESQSMDLCLFSCSDSFQLWGWVHGFSFTTQPLCSGSSQTGVDNFQTFFFFFFFWCKISCFGPSVSCTRSSVTQCFRLRFVWMHLTPPRPDYLNFGGLISEYLDICLSIWEPVVSRDWGLDWRSHFSHLAYITSP